MTDSKSGNNSTGSRTSVTGDSIGTATMNNCDRIGSFLPKNKGLYWKYREVLTDRFFVFRPNILKKEIVT
jgi:hypothetical protein